MFREDKGQDKAEHREVEGQDISKEVDRNKFYIIERNFLI